MYASHADTAESPEDSLEVSSDHMQPALDSVGSGHPISADPVLPPPSPSAAPPLLLQGSSWLVDLKASETLLRALSRIKDIFLKGCVSITPHKVALESCRSELLGFTALSPTPGAHTAL